MNVEATPRSWGRWGISSIAVGVLVVVARLFAAGSGVHLPNTPGASLRFVVTQSPCPMDANGDGVADMAVRGLAGATTDAVVGVDGRTAKELWRVGASESDRLFCAGPHAIVVAAKAGGGRALSPRDGKLLASLPADLAVDRVAGAGDCFLLIGADGRKFALDIHGAPATQCDGTDTPPGWQWKRRFFDATVQVGGRLVNAKEVPGTSQLVLMGYAGSAAPWKTPVPIAVDTISLSMAPARAGVVIAGHPVGKDHELHLVYVAADDGKVVYDESLPTSRPGIRETSEVTIDPNDRVLVVHGGVLQAFDASTGAAVWTFTD